MFPRTCSGHGHLETLQHLTLKWTVFFNLASCMISGSVSATLYWHLVASGTDSLNL